MASLICCGFLLMVLLNNGQFLSQLPKVKESVMVSWVQFNSRFSFQCILSSIIVVIASNGIILQTRNFFEFQRQRFIDKGIWILTFLTVVVVNIDIGLLAGFTASTIVLFVRSLWTHVSLSGIVPNTDLYLDINHYDSAVEIPGLKIFRFW